jgi:uncharacterized protein YdeI (YjbR/CyaY-like superfamily)
MNTKVITEMPVMAFPSQHHWKEWLHINHSIYDGVWMRIYKKDTGISTVTHDEALDISLCYGWIDGQAKKYDDSSYLQKFTPRRQRSLWSKRNIEKVTLFIAEGKVHEAGMKAIEAAKADGRWQSAYDSPSNSEVPEDFILELSKDAEAFAFFKTLNKTNLYSITWRLQTAAKAETRIKRMQSIIEMLSRKEKFH